VADQLWLMTRIREEEKDRSLHVILHQSAKFYPNRTTLGGKKLRYINFQDGGSPPSWILGVQ